MSKPNNLLKELMYYRNNVKLALPSNYYIHYEECTLPHLNLSWNGSPREADW